jgi:hypothetical protein
MGPEVLSEVIREAENLEEDPLSLVQAVRRLATEDSLLSIIHSALDDPGRIQQIAARSLDHANGFRKLVLAHQDEIQIRLHVWDASSHAGDGKEQAPLENAHTHRWAFATILLAGSYTAMTFEPIAGSSFARHIYTSRTGGRDYELEPAGQCDLRVTTSSELSPGSAYWLSPGVVHRVSLTEPPAYTATLLIVGRQTTSRTHVFIPTDPSTSSIGSAEHMSIDETSVSESLRRLCEELHL